MHIDFVCKRDYNNIWVVTEYDTAVIATLQYLL